MTAIQASRPGNRNRLAVRLLGERGASAVEFALVLPVLLLLFFGIVEFSQVFQVQAQLSAAAREGARAMAVSNDLGQVTTAVHQAAPSLTIPDAQITVSPVVCEPTNRTQTVTVTVRYTQPFASGLLGRAGVDLTGKAVMRCGG